MTERPTWWQTGVVYQVYPRSFADSNGDGVGDLPGITSRLDYLSWLGIDAIWISPFYRSPMADFGYDVSDYVDVDPIFGSLSDFDTMLAEAHRRNIRVIVDYVPNHTSDQHHWFVASRSSRTDARRDWYVWRDPAPDGGPPNNWVSMFGGPAWTLDPATGQYYLHSFLKEQPDLNWRNPQVRRAMLDVLRFWLDRGVDGFRIDVIQFVAKDPQLRDNPPNPDADAVRHRGEWQTQLHLYDHGHADIHEINREIRRLVDSYPGDRMTIGELHHPEYDVWARYYGEELDEIHLPFNFHLMNAKWEAATVHNVVNGVMAALPPGAWANWVLGNHDQSRVASRIGREQAPLAMMLLLSLPGAPTIYYGDELGMENGVIPVERVSDTWGLIETGLGRDPERTPMQWDASPNAGFSAAGAETWLPLSDGWETRNVEVQRADQRSMLHFTRRLLALRRENPALGVGRYVPLEGTPVGVFAFLRRVEGSPVVLVALNLGDGPAELRFDAPSRVLIGTDPDRAGEQLGDAIALAPHEGLIASVEADGR